MKAVKKSWTKSSTSLVSGLNLSYFHDKNGGALLALASQFLIWPLLLADAAQIKADTVAGNYLVGSTIKLAPTLDIAKFLES